MTEPELEKDTEDLLTYNRWARAKYNEIQSYINPCTADGRLDPVRLNEVLTKFGGHFAWAITVVEIESNKLNILQAEYDEWFKGKWEQAMASLIRERGGGRIPSAESVRARITVMLEGEVEKRNKKLHDQKSRVDLLKGFVRVLEKQAGILQTLSSNMRSELFFAGGIPIGENLTEKDKTKRAKSIVLKAIKCQQPENY